MTQDEQAITEIVKKLEGAWNASDSKTWTSHFAPDAVFIHIFGGQLDGHEAIETAHRAIFDTIYKGSRNHYTVQGIRFLRTDVALAFVEAHLQFSEGGQPREIHARPTLTLVKQDARWLIAMFQNTRISEMPRAVRSTNQ
ncbi:MAG TPA: SgcJ/EcaC family oxidoreductase [Terriglobia bacterium]|nr:SgcJ/EcaC family oxidoreductase [Terriglobia bacterium]